MLAPLKLPFTITFVLCAIAWMIGALLVRKPKPIAIISILVPLLFVPSCLGVMKILDSYRYGRFDYASAHEVPDDGYIQLPESAENIILVRNGRGHIARFNVNTQQLRAWIDLCRSRRPDLNRNVSPAEWEVKAFRNSEPDVMQIQQLMFRKSFPGVNWSYDPSMVRLSVNLSDRGGGFEVWHLGSTGDTYMQAWYL